MACKICMCQWDNSSSPGPNDWLFTDDIFKCIFVNEKFCISIQISLNFVPRGAIYNKPALVQVMACRLIAWTNAIPVHWRIYAAPGGDGLIDRKRSKGRETIPPPLLLTWFNFNPSMDKWLHVLQSVGWNYLSIPKLQRCNRWSLGMDKWFLSHTLLGMWFHIHAGIKVNPC